MPAHTSLCPNCAKLTHISSQGRILRCDQCGHRWAPAPPVNLPLVIGGVSVLFATLLGICALAGYLDHRSHQLEVQQAQVAEAARIARVAAPIMAPPAPPADPPPPRADPPRQAAIFFPGDPNAAPAVPDRVPEPRPESEPAIPARFEPRPDPELDRFLPIFTEWCRDNHENFMEVMSAQLPPQTRPRVLHSRVVRRVDDFVARHRLGGGKQLEKVILTGVAVNQDGNLLQNNPGYAVPREELEAVMAVLEICKRHEETQAQQNEQAWNSYMQRTADNMATGSFLYQSADAMSNRYAQDLQNLKAAYARRYGIYVP